MATSPLISVSGPHLPDLLFSARAAFIWNQTLKCVVWMNPAARAAFACSLENFTDLLPQSVLRRFAQCVRKQAGAEVTLKNGAGALRFSVERLELAGEQHGLIVSEIDVDGERRSHPQKLAPSPATARETNKPAEKAIPRNPPAPALTPEEMRAFKAIGRKVRRLTKGKRVEALASPPPCPDVASQPAPCAAGLPPEQAMQALRDALSAFDLVLFLDERLVIRRIEGRPARLGWRKAKLGGRPATEVIAPFEEATLRRMVKKLAGPATLAARSESGEVLSCRAALGRWKEGPIAYFLGFLALEFPECLEDRKPAAPVSTPRLAA